MQEIAWKFRRFKQGIENIVHFSRVIWNFEPWDWEYNMQVFLKSLELTGKHLKNSTLVNGKQDAQEIEEVIHLLDSKVEFKPVDELLEEGILNRTVNITEEQKTKLKNYFAEEEEFIGARWSQGMDILKIKMRNWWE